MLMLIFVFSAATLVDSPLDHIQLFGSMGVYYGVDLENPVFAILDLFRPASVLDDNPLLICLLSDLKSRFQAQAVLVFMLRMLALTLVAVQVVWMIVRLHGICYQVCG